MIDYFQRMFSTQLPGNVGEWVGFLAVPVTTLAIVGITRLWRRTH